MDTKKILLSGASVEAKLTAIAVLLGKEMPKLEARVDAVQKLQGPQGQRGADGKDGKAGPSGKDGKDGVSGKDGAQGPKGEDGVHGVSVSEAQIDFDGSLIISLSNGREINVGEVVAPELAEKIRVITNGGGTSQSVLDSIDELQAAVEAFGVVPMPDSQPQNIHENDSTLISQIVELQKKVDGLEMIPKTEALTATTAPDSYFASPITITATTTDPTKPTAGILVDEINVVDDGSGWCECNLTFKVDPSFPRVGGANGNGQYIFHLPAGVEFDSTLHAPFTNVTDTPGADDFRFSLPAVVSLAVSGFASVAGNVFPFSATSFRMTSQRGIAAATFIRSGSFQMDIVITYQTSFRFKKA